MKRNPKNIQLIFIIYWVLLAYIIAALIFWFIALNQQNLQTVKYKIEKLDANSPNYKEEINKINDSKKRKIAQYIGEGSTFLILIIAGAIFVFRAVRRQLKQTQEQQNFMIAITHELKTPIAVTKLNLETLQKRRLDEAQQQKLIQNTLQEANRLNSLCNNLLLSSQMEAKLYKIYLEETNWTDIVENAVSEFKVRYTHRKVNTEIADDCNVNGDPMLLQILINNLLDNANKYSPKDMPIHVNLRTDNGQIFLEIKDNGLGILDAEKKKVFEKFYRAGNEATKRAKGTGLGLYLCNKIVNIHKGKISVADNEKTGSIFIVCLKNI